MNRSSFYSVIHLSIGFILIFTSYSVAQTFQTSSEYAKDGAFAVGIIYFVFCLTNLGLSSLIIRQLSPRLTLILSSVTYVSFIAANIKYHKWALYITAGLLGLGAALLWTAQGVYVTIATNNHERVNNLEPSSTRGLVNGMFFGLFQLHQIIGNLLVAFLFRMSVDRWIIFAIMTVIAGLGSISLLFLAPVTISKVAATQQSFLSSLSIIVDLRFGLLIPVMCYNGLAQGFIYGCVPPMILNASQKFFVFAVYGAVNACSCICFGKLSDAIGRRFLVLIIGVLAHAITFVLLLTVWKLPLDQSRTDIFVSIVFGLGVGDAVVGTLLFSIVAIFYGETRPADAFASLKVFQAGFTAIGFVQQVYVQPHMQLLILIALLFVAVIAFTYEHYVIASFDTDTSKPRKEINNNVSTKVETNIDDQVALTLSPPKNEV